jgi:hypothetical protein
LTLLLASSLVVQLILALLLVMLSLAIFVIIGAAVSISILSLPDLPMFDAWSEQLILTL